MARRVLNSHYYTEWGYVRGRQFLQILMATGTILAMNLIGGQIGTLMAPEVFIVEIVCRIVFMAFGYFGIDWALANSLSSWSTVEKEEEEEEEEEEQVQAVEDGVHTPLYHEDGKPVEPDIKKIQEMKAKQKEKERREAQKAKELLKSRFQIAYALLSLVSSVGLSLVANSFISADISGESHLSSYNERVDSMMNQQTRLKFKALELLQKAPEEQKTIARDAQKRAKAIIDKVLAEGSENWRATYYSQHKNKNSWLWTCMDCAKSFRNWRDKVKQAIQEAEQISSSGQNHIATMTATLSPTLSYSLEKDSSLLSLKENVLVLEEERKERRFLVNQILLWLTVCSGILAFFSTFICRLHRKAHGQQVPENHVVLIMYISDVISRIGGSILNLLYTICSAPYRGFIYLGLVSEYQLRAEKEAELMGVKAFHISGKELPNVPHPHGIAVNVEHGSVLHTDRPPNAHECLVCYTDISHRRSDAKYCSDECRWKANNFTRMMHQRKRSSGRGSRRSKLTFMQITGELFKRVVR